MQQGGGNRDRNPFGREIVRPEITVEVIDAFAVDCEIGSQLAVANLTGKMRIAVFADELDDVHDDKTVTVGNRGQLERSLELAAFRLRRVKRGGRRILVAEVMGGGVDDDAAALSLRP